jgi:hypothetical protein
MAVCAAAFLPPRGTNTKKGCSSKAIAHKRARAFSISPWRKDHAEHQERATGVGGDELLLRFTCTFLLRQIHTRDKSPRRRNHVLQIKITLAVQLLQQISIM